MHGQQNIKCSNMLTGGIQLFFRRSGKSRVWRGTDGVRLCLKL
jgi:hypothetical protein